MDKTQLVAKLERDYLYEKWNKEGGEYNNHKAEAEWTVNELLQHSGFSTSDELPTERTRFRLKDDDGEIYYGGWLLNDDGCHVQMIVLEWGTYDSGCTTIEVKLEGEWVQEIG